MGLSRVSSARAWRLAVVLFEHGPAAVSQYWPATQFPGLPTALSGTEIITQPHCHHHAVLGWKADADLLKATGAKVRRLAGCCGLAGNFGVEIGHYEVSVAVAEQNLLPALDAAPEAVVLADGFSCRIQVADLRDRPAVHLAQLIDR